VTPARLSVCLSHLATLPYSLRVVMKRPGITIRGNGKQSADSGANGSQASHSLHSGTFLPSVHCQQTLVPITSEDYIVVITAHTNMLEDNDGRLFKAQASMMYGKRNMSKKMWRESVYGYRAVICLVTTQICKGIPSELLRIGSTQQRL
jgi:hypothetical protein